MGCDAGAAGAISSINWLQNLKVLKPIYFLWLSFLFVVGAEADPTFGGIPLFICEDRKKTTMVK
jgi:hypothetical protein